jgi:hypothetical protein
LAEAALSDCDFSLLRIDIFPRIVPFLRNSEMENSKLIPEFPHND